MRIRGVRGSTGRAGDRPMGALESIRRSCCAWTLSPVLLVAVQFSLSLFPVLVTGPLSTIDKT